MPDFERVFDSLHEHIADTPEEKSYVKGYVAGKNKARMEVLWIICFSFVILVLAQLLLIS